MNLTITINHYIRKIIMNQVLIILYISTNIVKYINLLNEFILEIKWTSTR
jgi:hypothetical protein